VIDVEASSNRQNRSDETRCQVPRRGPLGRAKTAVDRSGLDIDGSV